MKSKLPLLNYVDTLYPSINIEDVLIVACQHILETTVDLFDAILDRGAKSQNIYLIGKCYSTNESVLNEIKEKGINVSPLSMAYDSHESFDAQFHSYIESFCMQVQNEVEFKKFKKIIILDDGGELISCMNKTLQNPNNVIGIEQTASGYEKLRPKLLNFPVINVAKSNAKLQVESPFIAEIIAEKLKDYLKEIQINNARIVIVGQGAIGRNLYELLEEEFHTIKYDIVTHDHPFPGEYEKDLHELDVLIGATGSTIVTSEDLKSLKQGTILVSASSSDREFPAVFLRKLVDKSSDCHENIHVNGIYIPNGGFPINFSGDRNSVAPEKIQFTRALLFAAVLEGAVSSNDLENEIIELNEFIQDKIILKFDEIIKSIGC